MTNIFLLDFLSEGENIKKFTQFCISEEVPETYILPSVVYFILTKN